MKRATGLAVLLLLFGPPGMAAAYQGAPVTGGGEVRGTVRFVGMFPKSEEFAVTKDATVCGTTKRDEALLVSTTRGVRYVVVTLEGISSGKEIVPPAAPVLANRGCLFEPRVLALPVGTKLEIRNDDPILHNTHARYESGEELFNIALPIKGLRLKKELKKPGLVSVTCDAGHTWMKAFLVVTEHPYVAVTDTAGTFALADVPPGTYTLKAWHEVLGTETREVTVRPAAATEVAFEYAEIPSAPGTPAAPPGGEGPPPPGTQSPPPKR